MWRKLTRTIKKEISIWRIAAIPGIALLLIVIIVRLSGSLQVLELMSLDTFLRMRPSEPIDEKIVIIGINEEDIRKIRQYPIPDGEIAALIKKIHSYKPRVIGLDIFKDIPVEPGYQELRKVFQENKDVIGIEKYFNNNKIGSPPDLPTEQVGIVDIFPDQDGQYRRYLLWTNYPADKNGVQKDKFSLSLRLATAYLSAENITLEDIGDSDAIRFGSTEIPILDSNTGGYVGTDTAGTEMLMNFRTGEETFIDCNGKKKSNGKERFPVCSLHDIKDNKDNNFLENILRDKIVLIGMTATNSDLFDTSAISGLKLNGNINGVEYHAHATSQIINAVINGRPLLKTWSDTWEYLWITIWGFVPIVIGRLTQSVWKNLLAVTVSIICLVEVSYLLLVWWGLWIPIAPSLLILIINGVGLSAFAFYRYDQALKYQINIQKLIIKNKSEIIKTKQDTLDNVFNTIHSGPLQMINNLIKNLDTQEVPQKEISLQVKNLNNKLRYIDETLRQEALNREEVLLLGDSSILNLNEPIHVVLNELYSRTLKREDLKYLSDIKRRTRCFEPIIDDKYINLNIEYKRQICQAVEEALCNVGKHAKGAKSVEATGKNSDGRYILRVKDDGCGISSDRKGNGTEQCKRLEQLLEGNYKREPISPSGCLWEISWSVDRRKVDRRKADRKSFIEKIQFQLKNRIKRFFS